MSTIAAISTPFGSGGIAVIRISGDEAFCITDRFFVCQKAKCLSALSANTAVYGKVKDKDGNTVDEVVVTIFKGPHSYTGEDTVEVSCHGGILIAKKVLRCAIEAGAEMAQRGEFSKRAFLNGKMDLSQTEGVIDLINAVSDKGATNAVFQMEGRLSKKINELRNTLLNLSAHIQALIDFPEEDLTDLSDDEVLERLEYVIKETNLLIKTADYGKILKNGLPVAVIGKPNVGKSSLLNALSGTEKAIVTDIAGTTRDIVEEYVNINGIAIKIMDTAGIRETNDKVEAIGVERSLKAAEDADLILAVFDGSTPLEDEDKKVLDFIKDKSHLVIVNKADKGKVVDLEGVEISAKEINGIEDLMFAMEKKIEESFVNSNTNVITNERHVECLIKCKTNLDNALNSLNMGMPQDIISVDLQLAIEAFGEIIGMTVSQEIVDRIFHNFCLGK